MTGRDAVVDELLRRNRALQALVKHLEELRRTEMDMLRVALHELAGERNASDRQVFARRWIDEKRRAWGEPSVPVKQRRRARVIGEGPKK